MSYLGHLWVQEGTPCTLLMPTGLLQGAAVTPPQTSQSQKTMLCLCFPQGWCCRDPLLAPPTLQPGPLPGSCWGSSPPYLGGSQALGIGAGHVD